MIRVVVVDATEDSATEVARHLDADPQVEVVAMITSRTAHRLLDLLRVQRPDLVVLDPSVAAGTGLRVVQDVMASAPVPILVLIDGEAGRRDATALLAAGAVDVTARPPADESPAPGRPLHTAVRIVSGVAVVRHHRAHRALTDDLGTPHLARSPAPAREGTADGPRPRAAATTVARSGAPTGPPTGIPIVAIGASTGGPAALAQILAELGPIPAAVLVVQHLHADFVDGFVTWMQRVSAMDVRLATAGSVPAASVVYVAPGGRHLVLGADGRLLLPTEPATLHRPSVDVTFSSLARHAGGAVVAVVLTGIGDDGAAGLAQIRARGGTTITQDQATSAVYGMPSAASRLGASQHELPLDEIAAAIRSAVAT